MTELIKLTKISDNEYNEFLSQLKAEITTARQKAYQAVNKQLLALYLFIGQQVYEKAELSQWGQGIVKQLSKDLQKAFPDIKGFSKQNLWRMKQMYETYKDTPKLSPLVRELPWTHNTIILSQTKTIEEKEFYIKTAINERWSRRELERQIDAALFERYMLSKNTDKMIPHTKDRDIPSHFKDEYALGFLGLKDPFSEKDLRKAIVGNLKEFFLEFGRYFTFVGEEYPIAVGNETYRVDLLFYHRLLKCLVAVELKVGKFKPEYVGKMQFYLAALDKYTRLEEENPSVGLILCKEKTSETVELAMSKSLSPMKISSYETQIIDRELLRNKLHSLPLPESLPTQPEKEA